jgi:hypothetical protein
MIRMGLASWMSSKVSQVEVVDDTNQSTMDRALKGGVRVTVSNIGIV